MTVVECKVWLCDLCNICIGAIPCFAVNDQKPSTCQLFANKEEFNWEECTRKYMLYMFDTVLEK